MLAPYVLRDGLAPETKAKKLYEVERHERRSRRIAPPVLADLPRRSVHILRGKTGQGTAVLLALWFALLMCAAAGVADPRFERGRGSGDGPACFPPRFRRGSTRTPVRTLAFVMQWPASGYSATGAPGEHGRPRWRFEGTIEDFALPDIFQLIGIQRKTGVLTLSHEQDTVTIKFLEGQVVEADTASDSLENRLGTVLVRTGRITQAQLTEALEIQRNTLQRLGHILVKRDYISQEELVDALRIQSSQIIYRLFRWREGQLPLRRRRAAGLRRDALHAGQLGIDPDGRARGWSTSGRSSSAGSRRTRS